MFNMTKINGKLVNLHMAGTAEFDAESKTLTLHLTGMGEKTYTGDEAQSAWESMQPEERHEPKTETAAAAD